MAYTANVIAAGHLGNLTAEQEAQLRRFWKTLFMLYSMLDEAEPIPSDASPIKTEPAAQSTGWFGRKSALAPPPPKSAQEVLDALNVLTQDEREQKRLREPLQQYLAMQTPGALNDFAQGLSSQPPQAIQQLRDALAEQSRESIREFQTILSGHTAPSLRAMVAGVIKHEHPDALVLRFLRARKWDTNKALVMMLKALVWRSTYAHVNDDVMLRGEAGAADDEKNGDKAARTLGGDFLKQMRLGKSFFHGVDRQDRPITLIRARLHRAADQCVESMERYTTYMCETGRFAMNAPCETICLVFDLTGFTMANMDYTPIKFMIMCFEANYPESLGVVLIHNAPWVFKACWKIIHGWLDPVIASKVHFTYTRQDLEVFIAPDKLVKELGGDEDWEFKYEEPIPGENAAMADTDTRDRLLGEAKDLAARFEAVTREWLARADGPFDGEDTRARREGVAGEMQEHYWKLDKYVRARSLYDRQGIIRGGAPVQWYGDQQKRGFSTEDGPA
ncbi:hypothetical protein E4U42_003934 [Claviceps africana]|uniref:CRAL-TRIO domain-containing protein n=1 Tax=Claviceps africana TaxID=83212 RepID=A0A8K0J8S1_9HYPO|nr:hypothetical protein E4U42_003934 [Claviceps africana]